MLHGSDEFLFKSPNVFFARSHDGRGQDGLRGTLRKELWKRSSGNSVVCKAALSVDVAKCFSGVFFGKRLLYGLHVARQAFNRVAGRAFVCLDNCFRRLLPKNVPQALPREPDPPSHSLAEAFCALAALASSASSTCGEEKAVQKKQPFPAQFLFSRGRGVQSSRGEGSP
jgi:hypothetical protein